MVPRIYLRSTTTTTATTTFQRHHQDIPTPAARHKRHLHQQVGSRVLPKIGNASDEVSNQVNPAIIPYEKRQN